MRSRAHIVTDLVYSVTRTLYQPTDGQGTVSKGGLFWTVLKSTHFLLQSILKVQWERIFFLPGVPEATICLAIRTDLWIEGLLEPIALYTSTTSRIAAIKMEPKPEVFSPSKVSKRSSPGSTSESGLKTRLQIHLEAELSHKMPLKPEIITLTNKIFRET